MSRRQRIILFMGTIVALHTVVFAKPIPNPPRRIIFLAGLI